MPKVRRANRVRPHGARQIPRVPHPSSSRDTITITITANGLLDHGAQSFKMDKTYSSNTPSDLTDKLENNAPVSPSTRSQTRIPTQPSPSSRQETHARSLQLRCRTETLAHHHHTQPHRWTTSAARERATWSDLMDINEISRPVWFCPAWVSAITEDDLNAWEGQHVDTNAETAETEQTRGTNLAGRDAVRHGEITSVDKGVDKTTTGVHHHKDTHHVDWLGGPAPSLRLQSPTLDPISIPRPVPGRPTSLVPIAHRSPSSQSFITHLPTLALVDPFQVVLTKTQQRAKERKEKKKREEGQA